MKNKRNSDCDERQQSSYSYSCWISGANTTTTETIHWSIVELDGYVQLIIYVFIRIPQSEIIIISRLVIENNHQKPKRRLIKWNTAGDSDNYVDGATLWGTQDGESFKRKVGQQYCYEMQFLWLYPWMRFACYLAGFDEAIRSQASLKPSGSAHSPIYHTGAQWLQWNRHRSRYSLISIVKQVFPKPLGNQLDLLVQGTEYFDVWIMPHVYTMTMTRVQHCDLS